MAASKGQNHIDFLRAMETALSSATNRELAVVKDSPSQVSKAQENEKHLRNAMLTSVCSYLEWLLPPSPHFHQRGHREAELTVWRAVRNALVHNGGDLRKTTSPNDAEQLTRNFLNNCQSGVEIDSDGKPVAPYFCIDAAGVVTLEAGVYFRARKLAFDLLVHVGEIVR